MKNLLILGAGTAGTMMANQLRKKVNLDEWKIKVVDQYPQHYYQPGFLFLPFGLYSERDVVKPKRKFIPRAVEYVEAEVDQVAIAPWIDRAVTVLVGGERVAVARVGRPFDRAAHQVATQKGPPELAPILR